jgi:23S rRNA (cytidine2498-2'-O)-methyltransferase
MGIAQWLNSRHLPRSKNEHPLYALPAGLRRRSLFRDPTMPHAMNVAGYAKAKTASACAEFICTEENGAERLMRGQRFDRPDLPAPVGSGDVYRPAGNRPHQRDPRAHGRIFPCAAACGWKWSTPTMARSFRTSASKFEVHAAQGADWRRQTGGQPSKPRLLLTFKSGREVFWAWPMSNNSAMWPMGIPRLKFPREAPSRSTLKLEEAWHHFIPRDQWDERLHSDMTGVDLGAAPGGWTWQLVNAACW